MFTENDRKLLTFSLYCQSGNKKKAKKSDKSLFLNITVENPF